MNESDKLTQREENCVLVLAIKACGRCAGTNQLFLNIARSGQLRAPAALSPEKEPPMFTHNEWAPE
jgi:hypothetical protein